MRAWFDNLKWDSRYALRGLLRNPAFSLVAILTAALGIGANTAVFSVVHAVILRPLRFYQPERLVSLKEIVPALAHLYPILPVNGRHFRAWQEHNSTFESLALVDEGSVTLTAANAPERVASRSVTWNYFQVLGVEPAAGRSFLAEEDHSGANRVAVVTDSLWLRRFGSLPLAGQTLTIDGVPHIVIGILPSWFRVPERQQEGESPSTPDVFTPIALDYAALPDMGDFNYQAIGRLRAGVSIQKALADLNVVQASTATLIGEGTELKVSLQPLKDAMVSNVRRGLILLFLAVMLVLLVACVNIANLLLEKMNWRAHECAIRRALGAGRLRLLRQSLTESLLLAGLGGALGVAVAYFTLNLLVNSAPLNLPRLNEVKIDPTVLGFAVIISALSGIIFGALPGYWLTRTEPTQAMRARGTASGGSTGFIREFLVGTEVALTLVLVTTGLLLLTSFVHVLHVGRGFETQNTLTLDVTLPAAKYATANNLDLFYTRALSALAEEPGVLQAGLSSMLPLQGNGSVSPFTVKGDVRPLEQRPQANYRYISSGYLKVFGIPISGGRLFDDRDRSRKVGLISEETARRMWPGRNPIGERFRRFSEGPEYEVIGVAADTRTVSLQEAPGLMVYLPYWDRPQASASFAIRTRTDPERMTGNIRMLFAHIDDQVPIAHVQTMEQLLSGSLAQRRFQTDLMIVFAFTALLLGCIGIYGVIAQTVARKTGELGVRIALGADRPRILQLVLRWGMRPVLIGALAGIAGSVAAARLLRALLFEVSATDPLMLSSAAVLLLMTATLACYFPARRAARLEPMNALRFE